MSKPLVIHMPRMSWREKLGWVVVGCGFTLVCILAYAAAYTSALETETRDGILVVKSERYLQQEELEAFEFAYAREHRGRELTFVVRDRKFAVYKTP
jgi:hypothetical protein